MAALTGHMYRSDNSCCFRLSSRLLLLLTKLLMTHIYSDEKSNVNMCFIAVLSHKSPFKLISGIEVEKSNVLREKISILNIDL